MRKRLKDSLVAQMLVFGVIILLSLAVIFLFNNELIRRKLRENTLALNEKLLVQTENKLKNYSESLNNIAMVMAYSPTTEQFFEQDSLGRVMMQNSLMEVLSNTMLLDEDIVGISKGDDVVFCSEKSPVLWHIWHENKKIVKLWN